MTARRALETLEAEGLAYSKGRSGRFISPPRLDYNLGSMGDFLRAAAGAGVDVSVDLLTSQRSTASAGDAARLAVDPGAAVFENQRLFRHQGHAIFLETEVVVIARCAAQVPDWAHLSRAAQQALRYSPLGVTADIVIRMQPYTDHQAGQLAVQPSQMGIAQEQVVRDKAGQPFCLCRQIWRGELAQFSAQAIVSE